MFKGYGKRVEKVLDIMCEKIVCKTKVLNFAQLLCGKL